MKLELKLPKFRLVHPVKFSKFYRVNPFRNEGIKALAIVLGIILLISAIVYFNLIRPKRKGPDVLPAATTTQEGFTLSKVEGTPSGELEISPEVPASPAATD